MSLVSAPELIFPRTVEGDALWRAARPVAVSVAPVRSVSVARPSSAPYVVAAGPVAPWRPMPTWLMVAMAVVAGGLSTVSVAILLWSALAM